jgi:hypothetical protein
MRTLDSFKLKLKKNKGNAGAEFPQYSLSYKWDQKSPCKAVYAIISALKGSSDVIIEVHTDFFGGINDKENFIADFLNNIALHKLEYRHRKVPTNQRPSIFGIPIGKKVKEDAHEIAVFVPARLWEEEFITDILPVYGARYYISKAPADDRDILNDIWSMSYEEKADAFKLILFNMALIGQMGIVSNYLGKEDFIELLGLNHSVK